MMYLFSLSIDDRCLVEATLIVFTIFRLILGPNRTSFGSKSLGKCNLIWVELTKLFVCVYMIISHADIYVICMQIYNICF